MPLNNPPRMEWEQSSFLSYECATCQKNINSFISNSSDINKKMYVKKFIFKWSKCLCYGCVIYDCMHFMVLNFTMTF